MFSGVKLSMGSFVLFICIERFNFLEYLFFISNFFSTYIN